jgi:hypothetical protein
MSKSRRRFLATTSISMLGAAAACSVKKSASGELPAGSPPAFGTAPPVGPEVSPSTFAEAGKLVQVDLRASDRALAAGNWRVSMGALYERRTGPRKVALEPALAPWSSWNPVLPGHAAGPDRDRFLRSRIDSAPLPENDQEIAFSPVTRLSSWIQQRKLTSRRLTQIYLDRLERFDPKLRCVITLTRELALEQARQADQEIAAGKYRGRHPDHLWRGALPQPRARRGRRGGEASPRCGCGTGRQAQYGRFGVERYLVRRPDHESVAARRRIIGIERGPRRRHRRWIGRLRDR